MPRFELVGRNVNTNVEKPANRSNFLFAVIETDILKQKTVVERSFIPNVQTFLKVVGSSVQMFRTADHAMRIDSASCMDQGVKLLILGGAFGQQDSPVVWADVGMLKELFEFTQRQLSSGVGPIFR